MTTAFKLVQDAIVAALITPADIVGTRVAASRERPLAAEHASDIVVSPQSITGRADTVDGNQLQWDVTYSIEIRTRGTATADAAALADPILEAAWARLKTTPPPAGVFDWGLDTQVQIDTEEASNHVASVRFDFRAQLRTQPLSLQLET